jgi:uncharacterized protein
VTDITPLIPAGRKLINAYGNGGFRISGESFLGSVLVFTDHVEAWPVDDMGQVTASSLAPVAAAGVEILLLGCGAQMAFIAPELRAELRNAGVVIDAMDTGAAARTYNVLLAEERRVAAALIAVP